MPKLAEAYNWATGEVFVERHDAMADALAALTVYRAILERRPAPAEAGGGELLSGPPTPAAQPAQQKMDW